MECPDLGIIDELLKKSIFHRRTRILLVKLLKTITFEKKSNQDGENGQ